MHKTRWTPGPWTVAASGIHVVADNRRVAKVLRVADPSNDAMWTKERVFAHAHLLAAALKMYKALEFIVNDAPEGEDAVLSVEGYNRACAALAEADGTA